MGLTPSQGLSMLARGKGLFGNSCSHAGVEGWPLEGEVLLGGSLMFSSDVVHFLHVKSDSCNPSLRCATKLGWISTGFL